MNAAAAAAVAAARHPVSTATFSDLENCTKYFRIFEKKALAQRDYCKSFLSI